MQETEASLVLVNFFTRNLQSIASRHAVAHDAAGTNMNCTLISGRDHIADHIYDRCGLYVYTMYIGHVHLCTQKL